MSTGAIQVETEFGPVWCHYSETKTTIIIRRHFGTEIFERKFDLQNEEDKFELASIEIDKVPISVLRSKPDLSELRGYGDTPELWRQAYDMLESIELEGQSSAIKKSGSEDESSKSDNRGLVTVPRTKLRDYYKCFKSIEEGLHPTLARGYAEGVGKLRAIWNKSRKTFEDYNNETPWTNDEAGRKPLPETPTGLTDIQKTNQCTSYFIKEKVITISDAAFEYVFREINPWQTRKGVFEDGTAASKTGGGGIDLLLKSHQGLPVIGEVKVGPDKNAFFALLQAMTYAVELSTTKQQKRLAASFPNHFADLNVGDPIVDIALIFVNKKTTDLSFESICSVVGQINDQGRFDGLNRVYILKNEGPDWQSDILYGKR